MVEFKGTGSRSESALKSCKAAEAKQARLSARGAKGAATQKASREKEIVTALFYGHICNKCILMVCLKSIASGSVIPFGGCDMCIAPTSVIQSKLFQARESCTEERPLATLDRWTSRLSSWNIASGVLNPSVHSSPCCNRAIIGGHVAPLSADPT